MVGAVPPLELEQNPSPKEEAKDFQNADERMAAAHNAHELAILNAKRGFVGKVTGSTNDAMNTGTFILIICFIFLGLSMIGLCAKPESFGSITDNIFKAILAVSGYVFGTKTTSNSD
jgi:uncharacterized MAPEG superfamily protein